MQNTAFSTKKTLNIRGRLTELDEPLVMGILNVTPDSFFDGGRYPGPDAALRQAEKMVIEGARVIDIGGYSSRPGAADISPDEEIKRVIPVIKIIKERVPEAVISIDSFRSEVARAAVLEGADIINDISGGSLDNKMFETVASLRVPYIAMHMKGTPQTMVHLSEYDDLVKEIADSFEKTIHSLHAAGVYDIIIDPGFGFAKTREQNFKLLNKLDVFKIFGLPVLVGLSRKSMVWKTLNIDPADALNGTTALNTIALIKGASILRVHDVKEAVQVVKLVKALGGN